MNVPKFRDHPVTGVLFHHGNYSRDSDGCILLGMGLGRMKDGGRMLTSSNVACKQFMKTQDGAKEFTLTVIDTSVTTEA